MNPIYDDIHMKMHKNFLWEEEVASVIVETYNISSMIDLGCGIGNWLYGANNRDFPLPQKEFVENFVGYEYCLDIALRHLLHEEIKYNIKFGDVSKKDFYKEVGRTFDCVLSVEVAEHLSPENTNYFIENCVELCERIFIFTAAPPGQGGYGHINEQPREFWIDSFVSNNMEYRHFYVEDIKCLLEENNIEYPIWIKNNLMVFTKR